MSETYNYADGGSFIGEVFVGKKTIFLKQNGFFKRLTP
jgi:hypothetical protein